MFILFAIMWHILIIGLNDILYWRAVVRGLSYYIKGRFPVCFQMNFFSRVAVDGPFGTASEVRISHSWIILFCFV